MSRVTLHEVDEGVHGPPILEPSPRDGDSTKRRGNHGRCRSP
nr:MAG TPA: hypothetical protein [Caudoviricetes sp.]